MVEANIKVIKAGRLIDGTGSDPLENARVIIEDSKIKAAGPFMMSKTARGLWVKPVGPNMRLLQPSGV